MVGQVSSRGSRRYNEFNLKVNNTVKKALILE